MGDKFAYQYDVNSPTFKALNEAAIVGSEAIFSSTLPDKFQDRIDKLDKTSSQYEKERAQIEKEWEDLLKIMPFYEKPVSGDASETAII